MNPPRVLFARFAAMGDCVMAAWAATAVRRAWPDCELVWAIESRWAPVVDVESLASRVYEIPRDRWKRRRWSPRTWNEQVVAYTRLRRLRFDWGVDLQGHSKTALLIRLAAPKRRVAARATDAFARALNPVFGPRPDGLHTVEWNHRVIEQVVGPCELPDRPTMPNGDRMRSDQIAIVVGTSDPRKTVAIEFWRELAKALIGRGRRVVALGGPGDPRIDLDAVDDQVGKLCLGDSIARVAESACVVAADTGLGHAAAACGTPVVSLFGPTNPVEYRPFAKCARVLVSREMRFQVEDVLAALEDVA